MILCIYSLILYYNFVRFLVFYQCFYTVFGHFSHRLQTKKECQNGSKSLKDHEELEPGQRQLAATEEFYTVAKSRCNEINSHCSGYTLDKKGEKAVFSRYYEILQKKRC